MVRRKRPDRTAIDRSAETDSAVASWKNQECGQVPQEASMNLRKAVSVIAVACAMASVPLAAHHSFAMFQMDKNVEYSGTVTEWKWQNPHVHFTMLVKPGANVDPQTM